MNIATDSSSLVAFFQGEDAKDVLLIKKSLKNGVLWLPPATVTEMLSAPALPKQQRRILLSIPTLDVDEMYWKRAGNLRARILKKGRKARLGDALIAQSCIDHAVPLITRDSDFAHFVTYGGLELA